MKMRHGCAVLLTAASFLAGSAVAQTPPTQAAKAEASSRFDRGLSLFNEGDNTGALAEFKRAYELIPHPRVLFNIGLTYAAMNRPADAVDALQKLVKEPGSLSADQLARAQQTLTEQTARVAEISVKSSVPASIEIDNVAVATTPITAPLRIAGGSHLVGAIAQGYTPQRKEVTVAGGQKVEVSFDLTRLEGTLAHITLKSHLPAADVVINGEVVGHTPLASSLTMPPGTQKVELRRKGYQTARQDLTLGDGASGEITLEPEEDKSELAVVGGDLKLVVSETEALVTVDGKARGVYAAPLKLPGGLHHLTIERGGFRTLDRDVTIETGSTTTIPVTLEPTPETRQIFVDHAVSQRTWSIIGMVGGAVIAGGGVGYLALNASSKKDAQTNFDAKNAQSINKTGPCEVGTVNGDFEKCNKDLNDAYDRLNSAKGRDTIGYVGIGLGAAVTILGVVWLATGDNPHKYDRKPTEGGGIARTRVMPVFSLGAREGMVGVVGSF